MKNLFTRLLQGKVLTAAIVCLTLAFVACSDGDSDFATRPSDGSSNVKSGESDGKGSSGPVALATPCKTETEDNCEYGKLKDDRDGQTYKTVKIGRQWWMAENLNYEYMIKKEDSDQYKAFDCYCNHEDREIYGCYYTWAVAMDSAALFLKNGKDCGFGKTCSPTYPVRGVCPEGWHLPSSSEWNTLFAVMDSIPYAMQARGIEKWPDATDAFGFSARPAGDAVIPAFTFPGSNAGFWSSVEYDSDNPEMNVKFADYWSLRVDLAAIAIGGGGKPSGRSVRCVKD
jgi:uncharacterized protein (TIGR02145 family)